MPAPEGNNFAKGNAGGGAPTKNQNAMKHGLYSQPGNLLDYLEREEPENYKWVQTKFKSYLEDAPFEDGTAEADTLLEVCVLEYAVWQARGIQVRNGIIKKTHSRDTDSELAEIDVERPVNRSVNRIDQQVMRKLEDMGVFGDHNNTWKDALEGMKSNNYVIVYPGDEDEENSPDSDETLYSPR